MLQQNGGLQAGYLMLAARALGLDCGPMAGFDRGSVDRAFLEGTGWRSILLINLGFGDAERLHPRNPRLAFAEACRVE
jgi:3-hydroxypropanoate dehydrogenase